MRDADADAIVPDMAKPQTKLHEIVRCYEWWQVQYADGILYDLVQDHADWYEPLLAEFGPHNIFVQQLSILCDPNPLRRAADMKLTHCINWALSSMRSGHHEVKISAMNHAIIAAQPNHSLMDLICENGLVECLELAISYGHNVHTLWVMLSAANNSVACLRIIYESRGDAVLNWQDAAVRAIVGGQTECVKYLHELGHTASTTTSLIAEYDRVEILEYLFSVDAVTTPITIDQCLFSGSIKCVNLLHERGQRMVTHANGGTSVHTLALADSLTTTGPHDTVDSPIIPNYYECLVYVHEQSGCELTYNTAIASLTCYVEYKNLCGYAAINAEFDNIDNAVLQYRFKEHSLKCFTYIMSHIAPADHRNSIVLYSLAVAAGPEYVEVFTRAV